MDGRSEHTDAVAPATSAHVGKISLPTSAAPAALRPTSIVLEVAGTTLLKEQTLRQLLDERLTDTFLEFAMLDIERSLPGGYDRFTKAQKFRAALRQAIVKHLTGEL